MAGLSDVLDAVLQLATNAVYPDPAGPSSVGVEAVLGVGWPDDAELDGTLRQGRGFVSIYPLPGERAVTEWEYGAQEVPRPPVGIQAARQGDAPSYLLTGLAGPGDVLGVAWRGVAYTMALQPGATPATVAAAVQARLPTAVAGVDGGAIEFVYAPDLAVLTGNNGLSLETLGAIQRRIQVTIWGYDQQSRNVLYDAIAVAVQRAQFLGVPMQDGAAIEAVRIAYSGGTWDDKAQDAGGYVRGLIATVDFQTTVYETAYAILFTDVTLNGVHFGPVHA